MTPLQKRQQERAEQIAIMREEQRMTYPQIAAALNMSEGNVGWICMKWGIGGGRYKRSFGRSGPLVVMRNGKPVRRFTPEEDEQITEMELEGKRPVDIARALNRKCQSILGRQMALARMAEQGL